VLIDLDTIEPRYLLELALERIAQERRAHENRMAQIASVFWDRPALGYYRQQARAA